MKMKFDRLWLERIPERGRFFWKKRFFSICSVHSRWEPTCKVCKHGSWMNVWQWRFEGVIFKLWPKLWIKWANRKNSHYKKFGNKKIG
jgi:hypothetical protein